ncbi:hypothetical protein B0H14DRAFT_3423125 [Mycena olivaceomarginata]|nr:hypothetical protein B0H14DRAFT_3500929 [Mycena olivaceomarginata]KAJ7901210.1 hypothetical protein B0H14DRAFT_3423125 [Mycena olivaceomarginata]
MSAPIPHVFEALYQAIHDPDNPDRPPSSEIEEDLEAEGETLPDDGEEPAAPFDLAQLREYLLEASKGVTNETEKEYKRLMRRCLTFLKEKNLIKAEDGFFTKTPDALVPFCICAWIMHE